MHIQLMSSLNVFLPPHDGLLVAGGQEAFPPNASDHVSPKVPAKGEANVVETASDGGGYVVITC